MRLVAHAVQLALGLGGLVGIAHGGPFELNLHHEGDDHQAEDENQQLSDAHVISLADEAAPNKVEVCRGAA